MKNSSTQIINGRILCGEEIVDDSSLLFAEGKIVDIISNNDVIEGADIIDAKGNYVAPGCIDLHVHGGGGHDFMEATPEAFYAITEAHAKHGTTSIYPTLAAASRQTIDQAIQTCESIMHTPRQGARILGLHLEGNYLNMLMKGGQDSDYIYPPDPHEYTEILKHACVKRWSASPELVGAFAFGRYATSKGVLVSLAHTTADYLLVKEAFKAGYTHATHFYNAMTGVHKMREFKHEGTIESIYLMDEMTVELVADGIHVPPAILQLVHKIKGVERTALVTDAMRAAACTKATEAFDKRVVIEDGVCKLSDRSALAGSLATADRLIRTMVEQAGVSLVDAVRMASETPARIMHIADRKGTLAKGMDADIILFDSQIKIHSTIVEGNTVYAHL